MSSRETGMMMMISYSAALRNPDAPGLSTLVWQVIGTLVEMGGYHYNFKRATHDSYQVTFFCYNDDHSVLFVINL